MAFLLLLLSSPLLVLWYDFDPLFVIYLAQVSLAAPFRDFLFRKFAAGFDLRAPEFDAFGVVHRALLHDLCEEEIRDLLNLAHLQGRRRVWHPLSRRPQIGLLEPVTSSVAVGKTVKRWHAGSRPS